MKDDLSSEAILIKRAVNGDRDAFGDLYLLHLNAIYRYIFYRIGEESDAEDLTENVFLNAWKALPGYRDCGLSLKSWLYRIAHNLVIDYHRRNNKDCSQSLDENFEFADYEEKPDSFSLYIEEKNAIAHAISKLTLDQQQIIILRFIEGLSHAEIALIMDKSEGACRMLQNRALIALNHQLSTV